MLGEDPNSANIQAWLLASMFKNPRNWVSKKLPQLHHRLALLLLVAQVSLGVSAMKNEPLNPESVEKIYGFSCKHRDDRPNNVVTTDAVSRQCLPC
jgi:hypothetical protein